MARPLRIAGLISGGGRTLLNLCDAIERGDLHADVPLVIASKESIAGVDRARALNLPIRIAARASFTDDDAMHDQITRWIADAEIDLVCLCGWLRWIRLDPPLRDRVINIHPALLPEFGGPGMYGMHVHRAVLDAERAFSGCTVHMVDEVYDHGPIILQRPCPVFPDDTADDLAARVFEQECLAYPEAIRLFLDQRVQVRNGCVVRRPRDAAQNHH